MAGLVVYVATAPEPQQAPTPFGGLGGGSSAPASAVARPPSSPSSDPAGVGNHRTPGRRRAREPGPPVDKASTSSRGVTAKSINVVFPVVNLAALSSQLGFAGDVEFTEQTKAIKLFVKEINDKGGINGRKINPIIANYNPLDAADERSLCKDWTEGSPAVFAVVDDVGEWADDNQLCVTQEGQTPLLAQWTTVTDWTRRWVRPTCGGWASTSRRCCATSCSGAVGRAHRRQQQVRNHRGRPGE